MKTIIIIPARYQSSRFPGKPLQELKAQNGLAKPLIQWSYEAAMAVPDISAIYVATDDERITKKVHEFGGQVIMTSDNCLNGTERCAEAIGYLQENVDLVINLQGDAPLTPPEFLIALKKAMAAQPDIDVATPVLQCSQLTLDRFRQDRKNGLVGGTTAVFSNTNKALYFSKEVIPFADHLSSHSPIPVYHHVGVYAYRPDSLSAYLNIKPSRLELQEGLEQLRFLENNMDILCVEVEEDGRVFWELNNPEDIERVEASLKQSSGSNG